VRAGRGRPLGRCRTGGCPSAVTSVNGTRTSSPLRIRSASDSALTMKLTGRRKVRASPDTRPSFSAARRQRVTALSSSASADLPGEHHEPPRLSASLDRGGTPSPPAVRAAARISRCPSYPGIRNRARTPRLTRGGHRAHHSGAPSLSSVWKKSSVNRAQLLPSFGSRCYVPLESQRRRCR
jgi:hypothetical protein